MSDAALSLYLLDGREPLRPAQELDVIDAQGYTQASWWNHIPVAAWSLMLGIGLLCNLLIGYGTRGQISRTAVLLILPIVISLSFALIADIDSPRGGLIRLAPVNLIALSQSLGTN